MQRTKDPGTKPSLSTQMKEHVANNDLIKEKREYDGNFGTIISTGSTLLDLALSGGRVKGGGLPGGILVEAFGPSGSGKTVILSEIAGSVQRQGGDILFYDPEARLNQQFAQQFGLKIKDENYSKPDTVTEVFKAVRRWVPPNKTVINGIFADSLAALSTDLEMDNTDGDKMGMRRAKEFSEELRKTCRIIEKNNWIMVCSNQVRINTDTMSHQKYTTPGGMAMEFYSSVRLRFNKAEKIYKTVVVQGEKVKRVIGVEAQIEVFKSSIWKPFHTAPVTIIFDYGVDDIRQNLQFIKDYTGSKVYAFGDSKLSNSMEESIAMIEDSGAELALRDEVIGLWEDIESKFEVERKPKY